MESNSNIVIARKPLYYRVIKRVFDVVFSACVIIVGIIPGLLLSVAIVIDTKGTPIYSQIRAGLNGKPFRIFKFRSMVADSDDVEKHFTSEQLEAWRLERKVEDDPRITKLGAILRKTSIDELPQFINVLLGQMSVIGPRPITFDELEWFDEDKDKLLSVLPGITGLWQTGPRNDASFQNGDRQKLEIEYIHKAGLKIDTLIFFRTFKVFGKGTGK